jgi:DNA polymerase/3'-5' exonuclease PolX
MSAPYVTSSIGVNKWFVRSAEGSVYLVQEKGGGGLRCSCKGYKYRSECRHIHLIVDGGYWVPAKRWPRSTIQYIGKTLIGLLLSDSRKVSIVGSYRRGKPDCKDIDIIVLGDMNWWTHHVLLRTEHLDIKSKGELQLRGSYQGVPFDISRVEDEDDWVWMLLYRTGSREFNIKMRSRAKELGLKMNEHGLHYCNQEGGNGKYIREIFYPDTELEVFDRLGLVYLTPEER